MTNAVRRRVYAWIVVLLLACAACFIVIRAVHQESSNGIVEHVSTEEPEEAESYWTRERMRSATPVPMPGVDK